jgi:signal peptidase I
VTEAQPSRRVLRWLLPLVLLPVIATVAIYVFNPLGTASADPRARLLGYLLARFPSESMRPTVTPGDILYIDTTAYWNKDPAAGDLLMYRTAVPPYSDYLHRVAAVPGDRVDLRGGNVWVNGMVLITGISEDEWPSRTDSVDRIVIPAGEYFLVGDDPRRSADSRVLGTVPRSRAVGRATHVVSGARPGPLPHRLTPP